MVLNKSDLLSAEQKQALKEEFPDAMLTSATNPDDVSKLHKYILGVAQDEMIEDEINVPYTAKGIIGEVRSSMSVTKEEYECDHIKLTVRSNAINLARLKKRMLNL
ncbi:MAG: GTP-binding protein HflX [Oceanospirillaceae bacterium]